jgi:hypothetical protein
MLKKDNLSFSNTKLCSLLVNKLNVKQYLTLGFKEVKSQDYCNRKITFRLHNNNAQLNAIIVFYLSDLQPIA